MKEKTDELFKSRDKSEQKLFVWLTERLLLLLKKVWWKLIKLVTGKKWSPEQKEVLNRILNELKESGLDIGDANKYLMEQQQKKEKGKEKLKSILFLILLYVIVPLFSIFILKTLLPKSPEWIIKKLPGWHDSIWFMWLYIVIPILIIFLGHTILLYYGKYINHKNKLIIIEITFLLVLFTFFTYLFVGDLTFLNIIFTFFVLIYLIIMLFYCWIFPSTSIRKLMALNPLNIEQVDFYFYKTRSNVEPIKDIILNILNNIDEIEINDELYKDDNGFVVDIDNFLRLFIIFQCDNLLMTVLTENGKNIEKDEFGIKIQQKIDYIFQEILRFWELKEERIRNELVSKFYILFEGYSHPSKFGITLGLSKNQIIKSLPAIIIIAVGIYLFQRVPEGNYFESLLVVWGAIVSIALSYSILTKEKK